MQRYGDFGPVPTKRMISGREAYGAYTKFATETANLAITVAKSFYISHNSYNNATSWICRMSWLVSGVPVTAMMSKRISFRIRFSFT